MDEPIKESTRPRKQRSDAGKRKSKRSAASALLEVVAALNGLSPDDISRVLSAASIFSGVANFAKENDDGKL